MNKSLGDRMKEFYENVTRYFLPRKSFVIIRIDGRAFHTFTKDLNEPFDSGFIQDMNTTAEYLCKGISGTVFAFVQSDEISLFVTDTKEIGSQAWFDNNVQKMASVSASMATVAFNRARLLRLGEKDMKWAEFDSRAFTIPTLMEVSNYFLFRQEDATRNSIQSVAQSYYSHKQLSGKNTNEMQEMIFQKGLNWNNLESWLKRGRVVIRVTDDITGRSCWTTMQETPLFKSERLNFVLTDAQY